MGVRKENGQRAARRRGWTVFQMDGYIVGDE
jgi:hypothetical protein